MKHLRTATQLAKKSRQPLPVPITSQLNPLHTYMPHTFKRLFNITHPRKPTSTNWCYPSGFRTLQNVACSAHIYYVIIDKMT